ncbi:MAG: hypothetical protein ACJ8CR_07065, partial [Roseiflexaceae bacterium]
TNSLAPRARTAARPLAAISGWLAALLDWRPVMLIAVCAALIVLCSQATRRYDFEVGRGTGPESDLPFMQGFHPAERFEERQAFRWSRAQEARIELPGLGRRAVIVDLDIVSHRAQWDTTAPPTLVTLQSGEVAAFSFPLRREGAHYRIYLPPAALADGALRMDLHTDVWHKPGDSRDELGIAIGRRVLVAALPGAGLVVPDRALLLAWPACLALLWAALRALHFPRRTAALLLLPLALGAPLLLLLDAPRLGFGSTWAIQFGLLCLGAALACAWALPPLLGRLGAPAPPALLRWLALLVVLSFALKYGGRLYPDAMSGDLQLHVNRYSATITGQLYIPAKHRGLPFPFPTGPYLLLAPLTLLGLDIRFLLPFTASLFETTTVLLLYLVGVRALGSPRLGLLAGAIYAITSAGFMTSWFAFETQVAAQWFSIALFALLALAWPRYDDRRVWWLAVLLLLQIFLGHIGLFINVALLGLLAVPLLWWRARDARERRAAVRLLLAGAVAVAFAMLFFYSAFTGLIVEQLGGVATGGLNGATGRNPIPRETTLWVTWQGGLITHFGFFPVLLMIPGAILLWAGRAGGHTGGHRGPALQALAPLLWATLLVSLSQAVLPLITLSSITTRWLMFSAWAIAVAGALGLAQLWRRGRVARIVTITMALYVGWLTLALFVAAMALRQAPIEPF